MSMQESLELGWIITDKLGDHIGDYDEIAEPADFFKKFAEDDNGHFVPGSADLNRGEPLYFETHPHNEKRVFVSMDEIEHGQTDFKEPVDLGALVRKAVNDAGDYIVTWGVIETRR